jgi:hypothetical protein
MTAQLLGHGLDLAGGHALDVHLGQRRHQRLLRALVALEQLGGKAPVAVAWHAQLELANAGDEAAAVVAGAVTRALDRALTRCGADEFRHLGFQNFLQRLLEQPLELLTLLAQQCFNGNDGRFNLGSGGHGSQAPCRAGWS